MLAGQRCEPTRGTQTSALDYTTKMFAVSKLLVHTWRQNVINLPWICALDYYDLSKTTPLAPQAPHQILDHLLLQGSLLRPRSAPHPQISPPWTQPAHVALAGQAGWMRGPEMALQNNLRV